MHDDMNMMNRPDDHEAKMARADLFKLAQYSFKLFKMINEDQELEGWVQAKITKAADYIASVYHYMEYEMKISEYGDAIENADMYSESIRRAFSQKLVEAKEQAKKAKEKVKAAEKELDEGMAPMNPDGATAPPPKGKDGQYPIVTSGPNKGKRWSPQTPGPTNPAMKEGSKPDFLDMDKDGDKKEPMKKAVADKKKNPFAKVKEEADRKPAKKSEREVELPSGAKVKATKVQGWQSQKGDKEADKERKDSYKVKEAADKCNHTPKGEKCPVHGLKECGGMYEGDKFDPLKHVKNPTAGEKKAAKDVKRGSYADRAAMLKSAEADGRLKKESTGDYSAKKAAAGKDIGKPGKNFAKIEKSAGGGEKGKKIAGAVLAKLRSKG